jgi:hypothetical protein
VPEQSPDVVQLDVHRDQLPLVVGAYHGVAVACSLAGLAPDVDLAEAQAQAKRLGLFESIQTTEGSYSRLTQLGRNVLHAMLWNLTYTASDMALAAAGQAPGQTQ